MEGVESKSQLLQEDSQITLDFSKWLAESIEGFQQNVYEVLEAIEQDESFSEMTAENYDQKKSYLIKHLTELSFMHKELADQQVHLIGEVKKQNLDSSDSISPHVTDELGFQDYVSEILEEIEQDESFSEMTAENYDRKKSYLIKHLTELSHIHRVLADHHVRLIGEVEKKNLDSSDSSSLVTQMLIPGIRRKTIIQRTPIGLDSVLSPGCRGITIYKTEDSESSFPLSPDSDPETFLSTIKLLISHVDDDPLKVKETKAPELISKKNSDMVAELVSFYKKFLEYENSKMTREIQETESGIKTQKANLEAEKAKVTELLELAVSDANLKIKTMGDELETTKKKLSVARGIISNLNCERHNNSELIQRLKDKLTSNKEFLAAVRREVELHAERLVELEGEISSHEAELAKRDDQIKELKMKNDKYISKISELENTHSSKEKTWSAEIVRLKGEVKTKSTSFDDLKSRYNNLITGRSRLTAQRDTLQEEKRCQDNLIQELETRLNSLQVEHEEVLESFHNAQEDKNELTLKVEKLEREVDVQKEVISELEKTINSKEKTCSAEIARLKGEVKSISTSFDDLRSRYNHLIIGRARLTAERDTLRAEKHNQDNLIQELETRLNSLQVELEEVLESFHNAQEDKNELTLKVEKLEREVDVQKEVISDREEEKMEAIRQLSSSLEHIMFRYKELHKAYVAKRACCFDFLS